MRKRTLIGIVVALGVLAGMPAAGQADPILDVGQTCDVALGSGDQTIYTSYGRLTVSTCSSARTETCSWQQEEISTPVVRTYATLCKPPGT